MRSIGGSPELKWQSDAPCSMPKANNCVISIDILPI
jgi:hypothetical protein